MSYGGDDQFDFMNEGSKNKTKNNNKSKKKLTNDYDDLFDLEDEDKKIKLPTISTKEKQPAPKTTNKSRQQISLQEIQSSKKPPTYKESLNKSNDDFEYEESIGQYPVKKNSPEPKTTNQPIVSDVKIKEPEEDNYQEEFQAEEKYEQDFEEAKEPSPKPKPKKEIAPKQETPKEQQAPKYALPPKKQAKYANPSRKVGQSLNRQSRNSNRMKSRSSARSHNKTSYSRAKTEKQEEIPNKYMALSEKHCPNFTQTALEQASMDKLVRENDKIRGMIKKFNDELNDLINKNIMQLKAKKEEKTIDPDDTLRVLNEQKNSNETVEKTTLRELQKLKGKEGEFRDAEYHLTLDDKIASCKTKIAEATKMIKNLQLQVKNQGNKLTKIDKENTHTAEINNVKNTMINTKRDQQKNEEHLKKLTLKHDELISNLDNAEKKYNEQLQTAKQKGVVLYTNPEMSKKVEDFKKRKETIKQHKIKTEALYKTKGELVIHELDQVRQQIKSIEAATEKQEIHCEAIQNETRKTVQKAKLQAKLSAEMINTIEQLISQMETGVPITPKEIKEKQKFKDLEKEKEKEKEQQSPFLNGKGAKKYHSVKNVQKIGTIQQNVKEIEKAQDDSNINRPMLFKKKEKKEEGKDQRIWKEGEELGQKRNSVQSAVSTSKIAEKQEPKQVEKKKPFVIKKNRDKQQSESQHESPKEVKDVKNDPTKQQGEQVPTIAPRMRFRKNRQEDSKNEQIKASQPVIMDKSEPLKEEIQKQQEDKSIFAPKRLNLKLKDKKVNQDVGYVASTVEKKQEIKVQSKIEEYKPKGLSLDNEPLYPEIKKQSPKIQEQLPKQEEKPKFNLKLRDRQKDANKQELKLDGPPTVKEQQYVPPKLTINLNDNPSKPQDNFSKQNNNPYANKMSQAPKRQREGPLKKPKAAPVPKQKFNIYEQAEDLTNIKESSMSPPKVETKVQEEPNLNQLLGINKGKSKVDEDLLIGEPTKPSGRGPKAKKDTNFFGDLQL